MLPFRFSKLYERMGKKCSRARHLLANKPQICYNIQDSRGKTRLFYGFIHRAAGNTLYSTDIPMKSDGGQFHETQAFFLGEEHCLSRHPHRPRHRIAALCERHSHRRGSDPQLLARAHRLGRHPLRPARGMLFGSFVRHHHLYPSHHGIDPVLHRHLDEQPRRHLLYLYRQDDGRGACGGPFIPPHRQKEQAGRFVRGFRCRPLAQHGALYPRLPLHDERHRHNRKAGK